MSLVKRKGAGSGPVANKRGPGRSASPDNSDHWSDSEDDMEEESEARAEPGTTMVVAEGRAAQEPLQSQPTPEPPREQQPELLGRDYGRRV